jgi:hypothetical protein
MIRINVNLLTAALLAASLNACVVVVNNVDDDEPAGGADAAAAGAIEPTSAGDLDSSGGPEIVTTGAEIGSSTDLDSTGAEDSSSSSSPSPLPDGAPCDDEDACESGVCSVLGACAAPCPCDLDAACVARACIIVGDDGEGAAITVDESPAGTVDALDLDVYLVTLPAPGSYGLTIHGAGVTAWVVAGTGATVATPDDSIVLDDIGEMTGRTFEVADVSGPISVIITGPDLDAPVAYYFWTTTP